MKCVLLKKENQIKEKKITENLLADVCFIIHRKIAKARRVTEGAASRATIRRAGGQGSSCRLLVKVSTRGKLCWLVYREEAAAVVVGRAV